MSSQGFGNSKPGSRTADASEVIRNIRIMAQAAADRTYSNNPKRNFNRSSAAILATYAAPSSAVGLNYATRSGGGGGEPVVVCGGNPDSASFPGTATSRLTIPDDADLRMGTSDFTIEWFQYWTGQSGFARPFSKGSYGSGNNDIAVSYEGAFIVWINAGAVVIQNADPNVNVWEHVALVRQGSTLSVYLNGGRIGTTALNGTSFNGTAALTIGNETVPNSDASFSGKITSFRWTKGTALYSGATLTVPTAPLAALPGTKLLIQGITDTSCMGKTVTSTNVTVSTDTPF